MSHLWLFTSTLYVPRRHSPADAVGQWGDVSEYTSGAAAGGHFIGAGAATHACAPTTARHEGALLALNAPSEALLIVFYAGDMGNWAVTNGVVSATQPYDLLVSDSCSSFCLKHADYDWRQLDHRSRRYCAQQKR